MKVNSKQIIKISITLISLIIASFAAFELWRYYLYSPWTKDGRIKATIYQVTTDVNGIVEEIFVKDNQFVNKGDLLLSLNKDRLTIELDTAKANLQQAVTDKELAQKEHNRNIQSGNTISKEALDKSSTALTQAELNVDLKKQALATATLNLSRSNIYSPVNGFTSNIDLTVGSSIAAGKPLFAIIDNDSLYAQGYFEESKISRIEIGDKTKIKLVGSNIVLTGKVESISYAIADQELSKGDGLLPSVTPNYNWIRLAQRIPVKIKLDSYPQEIKLIAGQTATIEIENRKDN